MKFIDAMTGWIFDDESSGPNTPPTMKLYRTTDAGRNWNLQLLVDSASRGSMAFLGEGIGWVAGGSSVFYTSNGGSCWEKRDTKSSSFSLITDIQAVDSDNVWLTDSPGYLHGFVYHSSDAGRTWTKKYDDLFGQKLLSTSIQGSDIWSTGGGFDNLDPPLIIHSSDSGNSWNVQPIGDNYVGPNWYVKFVSSRIGFCGGWGPLRKTTDGGAHWNVALLRGIYDISIVDERNIWVAGTTDQFPRNAIYRSTDGGRIWTSEWDSTGSDVFSPKNISFINDQVGWAAGDIDDSTGTFMRIFIRYHDAAGWHLLIP